MLKRLLVQQLGLLGTYTPTFGIQMLSTIEWRLTVPEGKICKFLKMKTALNPVKPKTF
jgi:hypothetical protein